MIEPKPGQRLGRYRLVSLLGGGRTGQVLEQLRRWRAGAAHRTNSLAAESDLWMIGLP